jgi:hypothetical protein
MDNLKFIKIKLIKSLTLRKQMETNIVLVVLDTEVNVICVH